MKMMWFKAGLIGSLMMVLSFTVGARYGVEEGRSIERERRVVSLQESLLESQLRQSAPPETGPERDASAEEMARVLYGVALHRSEEAREAVCWCILNRVESSLFPNGVQEVCRQENQWMGYSEGNPVVEELYETARRVLEVWRGGGTRKISPDYLFLSWSEEEIALRTSFEETARTHYWYAEG